VSRCRDISADPAAGPDISLLLLLCTEISADAESGCEISAVEKNRDRSQE
jgi:hypothetical protein